MAEAPGHRLGQIIGEALEIALEPLLRDFSATHDLYLDTHGPRPARAGQKVTWVDINGNKHDLDFVIERGGTPTKIGVPVAFIESAWRRYTKHSRNKAQEIQGAVEPLIRRYASVKPFGGAIVGGQWTQGALTQLTSLGFAVAYIRYEEVVAAFRVVGIDVATNEATTDAVLADQVRRYEHLSSAEKLRLGNELRSCAPEQFSMFMEALEKAVVRRVQRIMVLALHGASAEYATAAEAVTSIHSYVPPDSAPELARWEVDLQFTNGDRIAANFQDRQNAIDFLDSFS